MLKYDNWGNLVVWLPIGKPCTITDDTHTYTVDATAIADYRSLKTAVGLPICVGHPKEPIAPNTPAKTVGTSLGQTRPTLEGGVEIECKITDPTTIDQIATKKLVEVSPCYVKGGDGIRIYNHLAVLPRGYARGGSQMGIKFEGSDTPVIEKIMTTEDISAICEGVKSMFKGMEEAEMESKKAMEESQQAMEAACEESKKAGYMEGLDAAKWLSTAKETAKYEGTDVIEAKSAILANAYPDLKIEGYSTEMVEGLLLAATIKPTVIVSVTPTGSGKTVADVVATPIVRMEGEPATPPNRYKNYVPKLKV